MIVKCITNNISFVTNNDAAERVRQWVNSRGVYNDLITGKEYLVQNVEYFGGGLFYYLHSVEVSDHPYPYVAELFQTVDSTFPSNWEVSFYIENGRKRFKRVTFAEWANDDLFFEKLIDGQPECVATYSSQRQQQRELTGLNLVRR